MDLKKIIVDVILFILTIIQYSRIHLNPQIHEIIGISLIILIIIHLFLNRNYLRNIRKGRYNLKRSLKLLINLSFTGVFILTLVLGILSSSFLNMGSMMIIHIHKILAYFSTILLGLHLAINLKRPLSRMPYKKVIFPILILFGIYSFVKLDFFNHLIGTYGFSTASGNICLNILYHIGVVLMIIALVNVDTLNEKN